MIRRTKWIRACARRLLRDERGSAGVEFALIAPLFVLIIAGTFEIGLMIRDRFGVVSAVSAAATHGLAIGAAVDQATAPAVASTLAGLLAQSGRSGSVNVNNAATARFAEGVTTVAQTGGQAAGCYCLSRSGDAVSWGGAVGCGTPCGGGGTAGRFVVIVAQSPWSPMLFRGGLFSDQTVQSMAVVQLP